MKLALVTDGIFPYVIGGMQKHSYYLAKLLAGQGVEVTLFHTSPDVEPPILAESNVFSDTELSRIKTVWAPFPKPRIPFPGHYLWESWRYSTHIFELIKPELEQFDFVYTKGFAGWKLILEKYKGLSAPPIGVNFHGYEMYQIPPSKRAILEHRLFRPAVKSISRKADYVFSYGGNITGIISSLGVPAARILEIPTGIGRNWVVSPQATSPSQNQGAHFVFVGRFERRKGIQELLAASRTLSEHPGFQLDMIGPIPESLQENIPGVIYHGAIHDEALLKEKLDQANVLVCPSYSEGMPNVIMEGMARGCAIIATNVGAVPIQVGADNGWLIPAGDTMALQQTMVQAISLSEKDLLVKGNQSIQKVLSGFTWEKVGKQTEEIITKILI